MSIKRQEIDLRLATNDDAKEMQAIAFENGFETPLKWKKLYPYWIVAVNEGKILGAIQTVPSQPVGRLEYLVIAKKLSKRDNILVKSMLFEQGLTSLRAAECEMVTSLIAHEDKKTKEFLKKHYNFISNVSGTEMIALL